MTFFKATLACTALALAACGSNPDRYTVVAPEITQKQRIAFASVEVKDVSLPSYAAADEIAVQDSDGKLITNKDQLWADNPERAIALELARNLAKLSGAKVASEPWPFESFPDARLEVRFENLVAQSDGKFRATGQYFVGAATDGRERADTFDIVSPYDVDAGPQAIAQVRGTIIGDLAVLIARSGLR
ncbi:PqiC family protein [Planktotalea sp.]|uniref:PqiC family protein n=1 Tax=Planktotalea sp. TaxID=2029877 RepID=UPI003F6C9525